jgi:predicted alpha/beta superfamily hydrolase
MIRYLGILCLLFANALTAHAQTSEPLAIGETFTLHSKALNELRRINVYAPAAYLDTSKTALPVLYMPDGGIAEDFLHVAGLIQVGAGNGTMRPFLLVGIENTQRRRDLTGPTQNEDDKKIAPRVGGSPAFRRFIRDELMPHIRQRYRVTGETAIVGESLAGLFVVETFLLEPSLFDIYIAFDPSLWWNSGQLVKTAQASLPGRVQPSKVLYLSNSSQEQIAGLTRQFAQLSGATYHAMPEEQHATIYHPAALRAFRVVFAPKEKQ